MHKLILTLFIWTGLFIGPLSVAQVSLPEVNLGATSFLDGVGGPGVLIQETSCYYYADTVMDADGNPLPVGGDLDSIASTTLIASLTERKVMGGYYGYELFVPMAKVDAFGRRESGVGDVGISPFILQWTNSRLFGRPYQHRLNLYFSLPTGAYSSSRNVNIGTNVLSFNPYYAATLHMSDRWTISTRMHYLWNGENDSPNLLDGAESTQAGQAFHINLAASYEVSEHFRLGIAGYALKQLTDHKLNGRDIADSREQVYAIGPGLGFYWGSFTVSLNVYFESGVENRPEGTRYSVRIAKVL